MVPIDKLRATVSKLIAIRAFAMSPATSTLLRNARAVMHKVLASLGINRDY